MKRTLVMLTALGLVGVSTLAADCNRPERAPFLCCVQECNGGLVTSKKAAPGRGDAGWMCLDGLPIDFNGTCTAEEGVDCSNQNGTSTETGNSSRTGSSQGASSGPASSSN
jgi:hypothetical protein